MDENNKFDLNNFLNQPGEEPSKGDLLGVAGELKGLVDEMISQGFTREEANSMVTGIFSGAIVGLAEMIVKTVPQNQYICPVCKNVEHVVGAKFCMICGTKIGGAANE